jgi:hypothetical protein
MANTNGVLANLDRKPEISHADPERFVGLRGAAAALSRRAVDASVCELLNEALSRLVALLYESDGGGLANVDGLTGRILVPLPHGKNGHAHWSLKPSEANTLRDILFGWQEEGNSLLFYEWTRHSWFLNLSGYGTLGIAKAWLRSHQITVALYRSTRAKRVAR